MHADIGGGNCRLSIIKNKLNPAVSITLAITEAVLQRILLIVYHNDPD